MAIRRRIYNPAHLTRDELKASFVARADTLAEMLRVIGGQKPDRPCQHMLLIGPRGMGKTTLGLRFLYAIEDDPELCRRWQPVAFDEESYGITSLAEFWIHALRHLAAATGDPHWEERAESFIRDELDLERASAYALAELMDFSQGNGKRLILFVENLDAVIGQIHDERQIHSLRATLIERPEILLLGSANSFFEAIGGYGEPLYEFFRVFKLKGVGQEEARKILETTGSPYRGPEAPELLRVEYGRLETIRQLTGGNPRLLGLACRLLIESPLGSALEDLERLIDEQTPYFKARIEDLPGQSRKVFHCLSEGWRPLLAKEVAAAARLTSSHASAQLKQLVDKGYAREVHLPRSKRARYDVSDRFYNIYYLLRFSRSGRVRLERLVAFLHDLFGSSGMRTMYSSALSKLSASAVHADDLADWLMVLAPHVAADQEFPGRNNWRSQAVDIIVERFGARSTLLNDIETAFADRTSDEVDSRWFNQTSEFVKQGRISEAEQILRRELEHRPRDAGLWLRLGTILIRGHRYEDALSAIESATENVSTRNNSDWIDLFTVLNGVTIGALKGPSEALTMIEKVAVESFSEEMTMVSRCAGGLASWAKGRLLIELRRSEEAVPVLLRTLRFFRQKDHVLARRAAVEALTAAAAVLTGLRQDERAIAERRRTVDYVQLDDPEHLRRLAVRALTTNCIVLANLERDKELEESCNLILNYVSFDDAPDVRRLAIIALGGKWLSESSQGRFDGLETAWSQVGRYLRRDDPQEVMTTAADTLALGGGILIDQKRYSEAEATFERATEVDNSHPVACAYWVRSVLWKTTPENLSEAEKLAARAVELNSDNRVALLTLANVLAQRGNWAEALDRVEQAFGFDAGEMKGRAGADVLISLIGAAAAGYGRRVKRIMEDVGLVESMEPLWHAIRAELGEELEPLPAEVMDVVVLLRRRIAGDPAPSKSD
ncbi:MAG: tetratricopeptide repeat protein [Spirochaetaceae bacterium]|nr:tetratricopeptide repeat protein [Spirochaetaceae bacterium]